MKTKLVFKAILIVLGWSILGALIIMGLGYALVHHIEALVLVIGGIALTIGVSIIVYNVYWDLIEKERDRETKRKRDEKVQD